MSRPVAKVLLVFGAGMAVLLAVLLFSVLTRPTPQPPPLPNPNGYDDFIKAGQMITGDLSKYQDQSREKLRTMLDANAEPLKLIRVGLDHESRVRPDYSPGLSAHVSDLPSIKRLAVALAAEGWLAELENRPRDAAKSYLDGIRVGCESARGGIIIDALVGVAVEAINVRQLEQLCQKLDATGCREVAAALEEIERRRQPVAQVLEEEKSWARRAYGFRGQITRLWTLGTIRKMEANVVSKVNSQQARNRLLLVAAAARAYQLANGDRPRRLADLVPVYLKSIPQDPLTGSNLVYTP